MTFQRRYMLTVLTGNLAGALLTFVYFRFLDPAALTDGAPLRSVEFGYFVVAFIALFGVGRQLARRWTRLVMTVEGPLPEGAASAELRRLALLVPARTALSSFAGWLAAALVWGFAWPMLTDRFALAAALRQSFGIIFVSGTLVATFTFLATERLWRERLPMLFPTGDLASAGAMRVRVRTRLVALFLLMSVLPMSVLSVATLVRAAALRTANPETAEVILQNLITVQFVLGGAGVLIAVLFAVYVSSSVARPLRYLQQAMAEVARGRLDVRCAVVSNDELGAVAEGFNRMVGGLREREEMRETFRKYVSPEVRDEILAGRASLDGGLREVTILFADLRDFTPWVEATPAAEVVAVLYGCCSMTR